MKDDDQWKQYFHINHIYIFTFPISSIELYAIIAAIIALGAIVFIIIFRRRN